MANIRKMGAAALMGILLWVGTAHATDPTTKCQEAKLKAQGKLQLCLQKNSAKVLGGKPDASAACQMKFSASLTKAGTACRYLDNGDGTVSDLNTGLVWEQKTAGSSCPHCVTDSYTWSNSSTAPDGTAFTTFLATLNNGASTDGGAMTAITGCFAGHCDWRLPSIVELQDIVDLSASGCGSGSPCIDPAFGPTQAFSYWSATTVASLPTYAWFVDFGSGDVVGLAKSNGLYVRAVRGSL